MKGFKLSNRLNYTILAIVLIISLGAFVYAYGTNNPPVFGHSAGEIEGMVHDLEYVQDLRSSCGNNGAINLNCPSGKFVLGGGCSVSGGDSSLRSSGAFISWDSATGNYRGIHCGWNGLPTVCSANIVCATEN